MSLYRNRLNLAVQPPLIPTSVLIGSCDTMPMRRCPSCDPASITRNLADGKTTSAMLGDITASTDPAGRLSDDAQVRSTEPRADQPV